MSRQPHRAQTVGLAGGAFADAGRWVEVEVATDSGPITIASTYVLTGEAGTPRQEEYAILDAITHRMA